MFHNRDRNTKIILRLNIFLCASLVGILILNLIKIPFFRNENFLMIVTICATALVVYSAIAALFHRKISIDLLASIALLVSLWQREWIAAIFINLMIASARTFINYVQMRSRSAVESLLKLKPEKVKITENGVTKEIPLEQVKKGDRVVIELGEIIPVDGTVEKGEAMIDQSSLTGESLPISKKAGEKVLSFTTVVDGHLIIVADKIGSETTFEKVISLVRESQKNKAPISSFIDRFANWYIILTVSISLIIYLLTKDTNLVIGLLLVSCADDIAISTPLALMSAITHSAKHGAIIKQGDLLENLGKIKIIVFDKTGTLTRGKLKINAISAYGGKSEDEIVELAIIPSTFSSHPIAHALMKYAKERNIQSRESENFEEYGGKGMSAVYNNKKIIIGKLHFFEELKIDISSQQLGQIHDEMSKGFNITLVAQDGKLLGFIAMEDELKPKTRQTISELKKLGINKTVMLTGDNEKIAQKVSDEAGIDEFHANLMPEDKLSWLKKYLSSKYKVAMVGDGVNDAPVLALSDIGIAMGAIGSDASIEAADIAMMKDDLSQIPELIKIGRGTMRVIRQNIMLWAILNVIGFAFVSMHILNPSGAAAYNFVSDFIPFFNSLRLFK